MSSMLATRVTSVWMESGCLRERRASAGRRNRATRCAPKQRGHLLGRDEVLVAEVRASAAGAQHKVKPVQPEEDAARDQEVLLLVLAADLVAKRSASA